METILVILVIAVALGWFEDNNKNKPPNAQKTNTYFSF